MPCLRSSYQWTSCCTESKTGQSIKFTSSICAQTDIFDTLSQIWDHIPAIISHPSIHIVTVPLPCCFQKPHYLTELSSLSSTSHSLHFSVLHPLLFLPHSLCPPHLTAYPGRSFGDAATGGCGQGLPVHGTAWSAQPLCFPLHLSSYICETLRSKWTLCCSLWVRFFKHGSLQMMCD